MYLARIFFCKTRVAYARGLRMRAALNIGQLSAKIVLPLRESSAKLVCILEKDGEEFNMYVECVLVQMEK